MPQLLEKLSGQKRNREDFLEDFRSRHIKMRMRSREGGLIDVSGNLLNKLLPSNSNVRSVG